MSIENIRLAVEYINIELDRGVPLSDLLDRYSHEEQEQVYNRL